MPNSIHVQLADAVVSELNDAARSWTGLFTATRSWKPWYIGTDLESLKVTATPLIANSKRIGRPGAKNEWAYEVAVDFQKQHNVNAAAFATAIDTLDKMTQDVQDWFLDGHELMTGYRVTAAEREVVFLDTMYEDGTWETLLTLKVLGFR